MSPSARPAVWCKMETLETIHKRVAGGPDWKVYAHRVTFGAKNTTVAPSTTQVVWTPLKNETDVLGPAVAGAHVVPSVDASKSPPPFTGLVRSAFLVQMDGTQLAPLDPTTGDANDLCIFTRRNVLLKSQQVVILG